MRLYDIQLSNPTTGQITKRWQSFPNGVFNPQAQNVIIDAVVTTEDAPLGGSSVKIEGISLLDIQQSSYFGSTYFGMNYIQGQNIVIYGGMGKGLPLANPAQAGLIIQGFVWQSFANWQGTEMSLDLTLLPSAAYVGQKNISFLWTAGTPLSQALAQTFTTAFPGMAQSIQVSPNRVLGHTEAAVHYKSVDRFASYIQRITTGQLSQDDPGVFICVQGNSAYAFDTTAQRTPIKVLFTDLVGQPTWIAPYVIQVKTVMRGDIKVSDTISLPPGLATTPGVVTQTAQGLPGLRQASVFTGNFTVIQIRQLGDFRSSDGNGWVTIFNCIPA